MVLHTYSWHSFVLIVSLIVLLWAHCFLEIFNQRRVSSSIKNVFDWIVFKPLNHLLQLPVSSGTHDVMNCQGRLLLQLSAHLVSQWVGHELVSYEVIIQ